MKQKVSEMKNVALMQRPWIELFSLKERGAEKGEEDNDQVSLLRGILTFRMDNRIYRSHTETQMEAEGELFGGGTPLGWRGGGK